MHHDYIFTELAGIRFVTISRNYYSLCQSCIIYYMVKRHVTSKMVAKIQLMVDLPSHRWRYHQGRDFFYVCCMYGKQKQMLLITLLERKLELL